MDAEKHGHDAVAGRIMARKLAILVALAMHNPSCIFYCSTSQFAPTSGNIVIVVSGTATRVAITYQGSGGRTSQVSGANVPWSQSWSGAQRGDPLYASAQISNTSGGSITVTITADGSNVSTATASGYAAVATASATY